MAEETPENQSGLSAGGRRPRRRHSLAQKLAMVRECLEPGVSLAGVALAHRVNANMVRKWVVKYRQGGYGQLPDPGMAILPGFSGAIDRAVLRLLIDALAV